MQDLKADGSEFASKQAEVWPAALSKSYIVYPLFLQRQAVYQISTQC